MTLGGRYLSSPCRHVVVLVRSLIVSRSSGRLPDPQDLADFHKALERELAAGKWVLPQLPGLLSEKDREQPIRLSA